MYVCMYKKEKVMLQEMKYENNAWRPLICEEWYITYVNPQHLMNNIYHSTSIIVLTLFLEKGGDPIMINV